MFGHDNDKDEDNNAGSATINPTFDLGGQAPQPTAVTDDSLTPGTPNVADPAAYGSTSFGPTAPTNDETTSPATDPTTPDDEPEETPLITSVSTPDEPSSSSDINDDAQTDSDDDDSAAAPKLQTPATPPNDELFDLKKKSLEELSPLLGHLDQTPEEKYKTTMMMIQATDDSSLIQTAHDSALQISDEKVRAQALLDIVNEINYFTQVAKEDSDAK